MTNSHVDEAVSKMFETLGRLDLANSIPYNIRVIEYEGRTTMIQNYSDNNVYIGTAGSSGGIAIRPGSTFQIDCPSTLLEISATPDKPKT